MYKYLYFIHFSSIHYYFCLLLFIFSKELLQKLAVLEKEEEEIHTEWKNKDNELSELERDLAKKQMKLDRATKHMNKLQRELSLIKDGTHYRDFAQVETP